MIASLESIFTGPHGGVIVDTIRRNDRRFALEMLDWFTRQPPSDAPFDWLCAHARIHTPTVRGPFDPAGRAYMRDPINDVNDDTVRSQTCCWGTGAGKTMKNIGQALWAFQHDPFSGLYVMPSKEGEGGARQFNNGSMIKSIEATACFADQIPRGAARHKFSGLHLDLGANNLGFVGANSSAQIAAKRCRIIWLDEQDKYPESLGREAGADYLAGERLKSVANSKLFRQSTPTLEENGIWPHLLTSDLRRRFLPCPHCNPSPGAFSLQKFFVLVKDLQFTVLPLKFDAGTSYEPGTVIPCAAMRWDKEAKRRDGSWDIDRVIRSTRFECPHCGGHIQDQHRLWMDQHGVWIPTRHSFDHRGYHLPSWYAPIPLDKNSQPDFKATFGGMAKKFLESKTSSQGMAGWINSDAAEVNASQEHGVIELGSDAENFATEDWTPIMTCDFQKLWPFIWFVVAKWSSFKLHPPFPLTNGRPLFADQLNPAMKAKCESIVANVPAAWTPLAEVLRFDPRTGQFPLLDYLLAQNLTGQNLVALWHERCQADTMTLARHLYREMGVRMPKGGDSEIIAAGHCDWGGDEAWEELRDLQVRFNVGENLKKFNIHPNRAVMIDSGYAEKNNPEVLRKCFESGSQGRWEYYDPLTKQFHPFKKHQHVRPTPLDCWIPYRGIPTNKPRKTAGIDSWKAWAPGDPFYGSSDGEKYAIRILEAASDHYFHQWMDKRDRQKEIRLAIAEGKSQRGHVWNIAANCEFIGRQCQRREDFDAQMTAKGRDRDGNIWERGTGGGGKKRHPDHLNDAAGHMQEALAETIGFFSHERKLIH